MNASVYCITVVPHITDAIQEWVERVSKVPVDGDNKVPDVCIIEVQYFKRDKFMRGRLLLKKSSCLIVLLTMILVAEWLRP